MGLGDANSPTGQLCPKDILQSPTGSVVTCRDPEAHGEFLDVLVTSGVYKELCFGDWYPRPSGGSEVSGYTGYLLGHGLVEWNLQRGWSKGVGVREDLLP